MPSSLLLLWAVAAPPTDAAFFEQKVRPLFVQHCVKCHGPDKQKGSLRLDDGAAFAAGGESGPVAVAGKPGDSRLVKAVRHEDGEMPPGKKLADAEIAVLEQWVRDGATWPAGNSGAAKMSARKPGSITDADRQWWAFQSPKAPPVPTAGDGWARTPIDRFVAAAGHKPAKDAEPLALLRRVTFDLTGLPPTPAEIATFRPDEYEAAVDRLLASPAYAQRQARLWLDLVRYADSDGYRIDHPRPHAWRYRDWVVRSFTADKPYDRFVREQLAGDEIAPTDPDALVATGYLRQWPYEYNQRDVRGQWSAILNDITDVTGDVFLGLGFGCARCHDHKFDPILQRDYFSLQAFFAGLTFPDEPVFANSNAADEYKAKLAAWEATTADLRTEMEGMLATIRKKEMARAASIFPEDIRAIFDKPADRRDTAEKQLHELAYRQVDYEYERAPEKLKKEDKPKFDELKKKLSEHLKAKPADPTAMVARDHGPTAAPTVIAAGRNKGEVPPSFPTVLGLPAPAIAPTEKSSGRRRALAEWLTRPDHPLTARVLVNRVWQQHFGVGLVGTPSDYGTLGDKPTHPQLLDHLAAGFVADGWSVKRLHKRIVTSAVYRQAAGVDGVRVPVRRLDAEQVRDALLAISGELKPTDGGPAAAGGDLKRSVFTKVARNTPDPLLAAFDAADALNSCARRNCTVTPTQSLLLLNGPFGLARAAAFAKRVMPAEGDDAAGVEKAFRLAYGRPPTDVEATEAASFLRQQAATSTRAAAWADFCHALLNSNEFLYLD